jgi:predicted extracellular nuclease
MGRRLMTGVVALAMVLWSLPLGATPAAASSPDIVISQVYGGGGNAGATIKNDFIELYNRGSATVNVTGWSVQYGASGGTTWQVTNIAGVIAPGKYYLIQESQGAGGTVNLPAPNAFGTIAMSATAGKVALRNSTAALSGACPTGLIDLVGFGAANCSETAPTATLSNTTAAIRKLAGGQDTDNNSADFDIGAPAPRATADHAPSVESTSPSNNAGAVAPNANIVVTFSEPVNASGSWFSLSCGLTGTHTVTITGGPTAYTVDPDSDFNAAGETCIARVLAANITDQDTEDPPDGMATDFQWSFAVVIAAVSFRIHDVQSITHLSPFVGTSVPNVPGIVTQLRPGGFYMQDAAPDADDRTSEGIAVTTTKSVTLGASVTVSGVVNEIRTAAGNLSTTTITAAAADVAIGTTGNALPPAIRIGIDRSVPKTVIENDAPADVETGGTFDPAEDGIDFWESLEGMRVDLGTAAVVGPSNSFGEISVVANGDTNSPSARGGVIISAADKNPERVIIKGVGFAMPSDLNVGDRLTGPAGAGVIGVPDYDFGNFMIQVPILPTILRGGLAREITTPPGAHELTVATFNVENLDPFDGAAKFATLAGLIVHNLLSPDVISLEEVQDNDGPAGNGTTAADVTLGMLRDAIVAAGGPSYEWREIDPVANQDGGEPTGNIRQVFFFNPASGVSFVDRPGATSTTPNSVQNVAGRPVLQFSPGRIDPNNPAFNSSRKPLAAEFTFNGHTLYIVANHFNSKGGDDALWGHRQPPVLSSEVQRRQQATIVRDFVQAILAINANAEVVVLGDLNDFEFSNPLLILKSAPLNDLIETLPPSERYTYVFEGNSQSLDHIMVSNRLLALGARTDIVHVNSEFWDQASDHEPQVSTLPLLDLTPPTISGAPTTAPNANGWWNTAVTIHFTCSDDLPGVLCPSDVTLSGDGADQSVTRTATDAVGNTATATVSNIDIDQTAPTITFTGATAYTPDQTVSITCTATDALSGIDPTRPYLCESASGPAFLFLGSNTLNASAWDRAGNNATASVTFTVGITSDSICTLIERYVSTDGVAKSLCGKIAKAAERLAAGRDKNFENELKAFTNEVNAQRGKSITDADATLLITLAGML